jgi:hypothetical protein
VGGKAAEAHANTQAKSNKTSNLFILIGLSLKQGVQYQSLAETGLI